MFNFAYKYGTKILTLLAGSLGLLTFIGVCINWNLFFVWSMFFGVLTSVVIPGTIIFLGYKAVFGTYNKANGYFENFLKKAERAWEASKEDGK